MIYLDNNATTKPSARVVEAMLPYLTECYFNASASTTAFTGVDKPRRDAAAMMARLLNAEEQSCFVFTSGATESNNWVLSSVAQMRRGGRIVVSAIEHASVERAADALRHQGYDILVVPVDAHGIVKTDSLAEMLSEMVALVSIIAASNETGVLQPLDAIGQIVRTYAPQAIFHTDATQAIGKISVDLERAWPEVDLLSFSAHKFHGPKGVGGLYIRPGAKIEPMLRGGEQEGGLRSGTTNTAGLAGLAAAAAEASPEHNMVAIARIRDHFEDELLKAMPTTIIHSRMVPRLPNTSCFSIPGVLADDLAQALARASVIVGTGAACSSGSPHPPRTLLEMGVDYEIAAAALRVSVSRNTREDDLDTLLSQLAPCGESH